MRHGLGKLKHVELKFLCLQGAVRERRVQLVKEDTETNRGDLLTKHLPEPKMSALLALCGNEFRQGRAEGAPELVKDAVAKRLSVVQAQRLLRVDDAEGRIVGLLPQREQREDAAKLNAAAVQAAAEMLDLGK